MSSRPTGKDPHGRLDEVEHGGAALGIRRGRHDAVGFVERKYTVFCAVGAKAPSTQMMLSLGLHAVAEFGDASVDGHAPLR
jgi:hypothetical protein